MWIKREIEGLLREISTQRPALILTGCRQAGKTSLLKRVFPDYNYLSLDVPAVAEEAEESGQGLLQRHKNPLIIDEVQYAPRLFRYIKNEIDKDRDKNGLYFITGSQKFSLMEKVSESLAGRIAVIECFPLSAIEFERWKKTPVEGDLLIDLIYKGGYPELHAKNLDPERFYSDYLATYLERDVRQVLNVKNLRDFDKFMRLAAVRTGQQLSLSSFASDIGISPNTVKNWLSVLEASNIIYLLEPYYKNIGKRLVKTPKLYFLDTGLAAFLSGIRSPQDLKNSSLLGAFFETHVLGQIIKFHANRGKQAAIYYFRDHFGHEVDFVIPVGEKLKLFECKWSENPSSKVGGFQEVERLIGDENIVSQSIIVPARGFRKTNVPKLFISDSVELKSFEL